MFGVNWSLYPRSIDVIGTPAGGARRRPVEVLDPVRLDNVDPLSLRVPFHDVVGEARLDLGVVDVVDHDARSADVAARVAPRSRRCQDRGQKEVELRAGVAVGVEVKAAVAVRVVERELPVSVQVALPILDEKVFRLRDGNLENPRIGGHLTLQLGDRLRARGDHLSRGDEAHPVARPRADARGNESIRVPDPAGHDVPRSKPLIEAAIVRRRVVEIGHRGLSSQPPQLVAELMAGDSGEPEFVPILALQLRRLDRLRDTIEDAGARLIVGLDAHGAGRIGQDLREVIRRDERRPDLLPAVVEDVRFLPRPRVEDVEALVLAEVDGRIGQGNQVPNHEDQALLEVIIVAVIGHRSGKREYRIPEGGVERDLPVRSLIPVLAQKEEQPVVIRRRGVDRRIAERHADGQDRIGLGAEERGAARPLGAEDGRGLCRGCRRRVLVAGRLRALLPGDRRGPQSGCPDEEKEED